MVVEGGGVQEYEIVEVVSVVYVGSFVWVACTVLRICMECSVPGLLDSVGAIVSYFGLSGDDLKQKWSSNMGEADAFISF